jgi:ribose transport system permease protein
MENTDIAMKPGNFAPEPDKRKSARISRDTISTVLVYALCVLLFAGSHLISPHLGSWSHVQTVMVLASFLVVLSFGQGLVILTGGLDLSLPALITLGGVLAASFTAPGGVDGWAILPVVICLCAAIGFLTALGVVWLKVPPFIMTMATSIIIASAALGMTKGTPRGTSPDALLWLMKSHVFGVPLPVIFLLFFVGAGWLIQSRSTLGRYLHAVGTNAEAARIAGLPVFPALVAPYVISAACAGFVGMMLVGYSNGATLRMGDSYMLPSIAAVVIGGSSILGGSGSFLGTVGGAILLTTLGTIISAIGMQIGVRTIIEGTIILAALLLLREEVFEGIRAAVRKNRGKAKRTGTPGQTNQQE